MKSIKNKRNVLESGKGREENRGMGDSGLCAQKKFMDKKGRGEK